MGMAGCIVVCVRLVLSEECVDMGFSVCGTCFFWFRWRVLGLFVFGYIRMIVFGVVLKFRSIGFKRFYEENEKKIGVIEIDF